MRRENLEQSAEIEWDQLLGIRTSGRDDSQAGVNYYPYESTPYLVLSRLAQSGLIRKQNTLLDYGCGKGRVGFFLSYQTRCKSIGIECDERLYQSALRNHEGAVSRNRVRLLLARAEDYLPPEEVDTCFFFHPFSVNILEQVIGQIERSLEMHPRQMRLMFYYPPKEYFSLLESKTLFRQQEIIDCRGLSGDDEREMIAVFRND